MKKEKTYEILLVEDNPGDIELTREALKESLSVRNLHVAKDGQIAMEFLLKQGKYSGVATPDLVLLDLNLPKKDGRQVLFEMKNNFQLQTIPVVILTTSQAKEDVSKAYSNHANCYLTKPLDVFQFFGLMKTVEQFWLKTAKLPEA